MDGSDVGVGDIAISDGNEPETGTADGFEDDAASEDGAADDVGDGADEDEDASGDGAGGEDSEHHNKVSGANKLPFHINNNYAWQVPDGGRWWLRDSKYSEPNGNYTANCWLSMNKYDVNDIRFDDNNCLFSTIKCICSTNDKK